MSTLTFVVEQAPQAMGYALYSVSLGKDDEGKPTLAKEVVAFKTTMIEIARVRGELEKNAFGIEALPQPERHVVYLEKPQIPAATHQPPFEPAQPNAVYPHVPLNDRPAVLDKMEFPPANGEEPSTYSKIKGVMDGIKNRGHALAWFAVLTVSYLSLRMA